MNIQALRIYPWKEAAKAQKNVYDRRPFRSFRSPGHLRRQAYGVYRPFPFVGGGWVYDMLSFPETFRRQNVQKELSDSANEDVSILHHEKAASTVLLKSWAGEEMVR